MRSLYALLFLPTLTLSTPPRGKTVTNDATIDYGKAPDMESIFKFHDPSGHGDFGSCESFFTRKSDGTGQQTAEKELPEAEENSPRDGRLPPAPPLLLVCKQVYHEAQPVYWDTNHVWWNLLQADDELPTTIPSILHQMPVTMRANLRNFSATITVAMKQGKYDQDHLVNVGVRFLQNQLAVKAHLQGCSEDDCEAGFGEWAAGVEEQMAEKFLAIFSTTKQGSSRPEIVGWEKLAEKMPPLFGGDFEEVKEDEDYGPEEDVSGSEADGKDFGTELDAEQASGHGAVEDGEGS